WVMAGHAATFGSTWAAYPAVQEALSDASSWCLMRNGVQRSCQSQAGIPVDSPVDVYTATKANGVVDSFWYTAAGEFRRTPDWPAPTTPYPFRRSFQNDDWAGYRRDALVMGIDLGVADSLSALKFLKALRTSYRQYQGADWSGKHSIDPR